MKKNQKKIKEAAALKYFPDKDQSPRVVAKGTGLVAEKILETAAKSGVQVYEDPELAHKLNSLSLGDEIPPELYGIVAEIFAFIGNLDEKYGEKYGIQKV